MNMKISGNNNRHTSNVDVAGVVLFQIFIYEKSKHYGLF